MLRRRRSVSQLAFTLLVCAFLIVPVVQSVMAGLTENYIVGVKSGLTLRWFGEGLGASTGTRFSGRIMIALACLAVTLVLGVPAAYAMVKRQNRCHPALRGALVTPLAVPGLATALALIISYGGFTRISHGAGSSSWSGHVIFTLPFMVRSVIAVMSSINLKEFEEGAASLGAGFWQRFFHIAIPNAVPGILAGALMVFTLSIGEFNLTWMLHTPQTKTLPVGLADSYASMRLEIGSAYTIVFFLMIIPLLVAMQWVAKPAQKDLRMDSIGSSPDSAGRPRRRVTAGGVARGRAHGDRHVPAPGRCSKTFADGTRALEPFDLTVDVRRDGRDPRALRVRQDDDAADHRRAREPDPGGKVFFGGEDVTDVPIEKRNVGMVFQSYALFPNMSVAENIAYGLKVRGVDEARRTKRVSEMLDMMKIGELRNRRIDQLSGGQKQRVALARAIAVRPQVLLLDEPLTALDAKLRDAAAGGDRLACCARSASRPIYVTHDQAEAMALGDRIVVMNIARVAQVGAPRDIYFAPHTRFVAEFIGTINRLKGRVQDDRLVLQGGSIPVPERARGRGGRATSSFFPARAREPGRPRAGAPAGDRGGLLLHGRPDAADHHGPGGRLPHDRNRGHAIVPQGAAGGGPGGTGRAAAPGRMRGRPA